MFYTGIGLENATFAQVTGASRRPSALVTSMSGSKQKRRLRWAVWLSVAVNGYIALADWALVALHFRGVMQGVLGFLDGISAVLQVPGIATVIALGFRHGHHTTPQ